MSWRFIKIFLTMLVIGLGGWWLSHQGWGELVLALKKLPLNLLVLLIVLELGALIIKVYKWKILLPEYSWWSLLKSSLVGQYYSLTVSGQLAGEAAKTYYLSRITVIDWRHITATVMVDKITGLLGAVVIVGLGGISFSALPLSGHNRSIIILSFLLLIVALGIFYLIGYLRFKFPVAWCQHRYSFLVKPLESFNQINDKNHHYFHQPRKMLGSILMAVLYQSIAVVIMWLVGTQVGINLSLVDWAWIASLLSIILLLPLTVGGLGLREATLVGLLGMFGVTPIAALAVSLTLFFLQIVLAGLGGVVQLWDIAKISHD